MHTRLHVDEHRVRHHVLRLDNAARRVRQVILSGVPTRDSTASPDPCEQAEMRVAADEERKQELTEDVSNIGLVS